MAAKNKAGGTPTIAKKSAAVQWLPKRKGKLLAMPLFFGILTYLVIVPLMKMDIALGGSIDVHVAAFHQAVIAIMSAMDDILPLVAAMVMGAKYMKISRGMVTSAELAIISLVFALAYSFPLVWGYAAAGQGYDIMQNTVAVLSVYLLSLIGCYIGAKKVQSCMSG